MFIFNFTVPSSPRSVSSGGFNNSEITWQRPEFEAGPISFYEVAVIVWYKNQKINRHVSLISSDETKCELYTPPCTDPNIKHTVEVSAVNEVSLNEIAVEDKDLLRPTIERENALNDYYSDELTCVGGKKVQRKNPDEFVVYISEPGEGVLTYLCSSNTNISYFTIMTFGILITCVVVLFSLHFLKKKVQKMYDIHCEYPKGIQEACDSKMSSTPSFGLKNNDKNELDKIKYDEVENVNSKDFGYHHENRHLLSEQDYGGLMTPCSTDGKSSGYIGSGSEDSLDEPQNDMQQYHISTLAGYIKPNECKQNYTKEFPLSISDSAYMPMKIFNKNTKELKPQQMQHLQNEQTPMGYASLSTITQAANMGGYVQPQQFTKMQQPRQLQFAAANTPTVPSAPNTDNNAGYVKPNNMWQLQPNFETKPNMAINPSASPYVEASQLQKVYIY